MDGHGAAARLLRARGHGHARVGFVELFFDLIFVFAVTQISHGLLHDLSFAGALRHGVLFLAIWWIWIDNTWVMNWLDPEKLPVRLMLFAVMLGGMVLAVAMPHAFGRTGPLLRFWLPGMGASAVSDWQVEGGHLSERFGLFIIIVLGESILLTGATFAEAPEWTAGSITAFLAAFASTLLMWWIYFDTGAERGTRRLTEGGDPGALARAGYTYFHLPIAAGIILLAAADELVLAHPGGHASAAAVLTVLGGMAGFLLGNALFKRLTLGNLPLSHLLGFALLALLAMLGWLLPPVGLYALATLALLVVAVWDRRSLGGRVVA